MLGVATAATVTMSRASSAKQVVPFMLPYLVGAACMPRACAGRGVRPRLLASECVRSRFLHAVDHA